MRAVAREYGVALATVQRWVQRAAGQRLDRAEMEDLRRGPAVPANRTNQATQRLVLNARKQLKASALGECGAVAIHRELERQGHVLPTVRTIGRILLREGAVDGGRRMRRPPPPRGWYLPTVADTRAEIDSFDSVEGLVIKGKGRIEVLNCMSMHGRLAASWQTGDCITARFTVASMVEHWRQFGLPGYAQFDNDTVFQGNRQRDCIGTVVRLCLGLGVTPVFAPPRETGFQAGIERFNGLWQEKVWARNRHPNLLSLKATSDAFIAAHRLRHRDCADAVLRHPFPFQWPVPGPIKRRGTIIFIRRTDIDGRVMAMGRLFTVCSQWVQRLVRAEVSLDSNQITFCRLRRADPLHQPILATRVYRLPDRQLDE